MFREMRRTKQLLPQELAQEILVNGTTGVLAVLGDDDYPYTVPLNYVYADGIVYFHCAKTGHKIDAIKKHNKVSFCVIEADKVVAEEFTDYYRDVIAFGKAEEVIDEKEKLAAMRLLNSKYCPNLDVEGEQEIQKHWSILCVIKMQVEHLTGKESMALAKRRNSI